MRFGCAMLLLGAVALAGCSSGKMEASTKGDGSQPPPSFTQFTDVPVPEGAHMDADHTLIVGPTDNWLGRLAFSVRFTSGSALFNFYKAQMPVFGWQEVASVRSRTSVLTWQRNDRIATVQISDTALGGDVTITMTPATNAGAASRGGASPPAPAPAPAPAQEPVTSQPLK